MANQVTLTLTDISSSVIVKQFKCDEEGSTILIGRGSRNDSMTSSLTSGKFRSLNTKVMSQKHASLSFETRGGSNKQLYPFLTDLNSTNGTTIQRIGGCPETFNLKPETAYRLKSNDIITFGKSSAGKDKTEKHDPISLRVSVLVALKQSPPRSSILTGPKTTKKKIGYGISEEELFEAISEIFDPDEDFPLPLIELTPIIPCDTEQEEEDAIVALAEEGDSEPENTQDVDYDDGSQEVKEIGTEYEDEQAFKVALANKESPTKMKIPLPPHTSSPIRSPVASPVSSPDPTDAFYLEHEEEEEEEEEEIISPFLSANLVPLNFYSPSWEKASKPKCFSRKILRRGTPPDYDDDEEEIKLLSFKLEEPIIPSTRPSPSIGPTHSVRSTPSIDDYDYNDDDDDVISEYNREQSFPPLPFITISSDDEDEESRITDFIEEAEEEEASQYHSCDFESDEEEDDHQDDVIWDLDPTDDFTTDFRSSSPDLADILKYQESFEMEEEEVQRIRIRRPNPLVRFHFDSPKSNSSRLPSPISPSQQKEEKELDEGIQVEALDIAKAKELVMEEIALQEKEEKHHLPSPSPELGETDYIVEVIEFNDLEVDDGDEEEQRKGEEEKKEVEFSEKIANSILSDLDAIPLDMDEVDDFVDEADDFSEVVDEVEKANVFGFDSLEEEADHKKSLTELDDVVFDHCCLPSTYNSNINPSFKPLVRSKTSASSDKINVQAIEVDIEEEIKKSEVLPFLLGPLVVDEDEEKDADYIATGLKETEDEAEARPLVEEESDEDKSTDLQSGGNGSLSTLSCVYRDLDRVQLPRPILSTIETVLESPSSPKRKHSALEEDEDQEDEISSSTSNAHASSDVTAVPTEVIDTEAPVVKRQRMNLKHVSLSSALGFTAGAVATFVGLNVLESYMEGLGN